MPSRYDKKASLVVGNPGIDELEPFMDTNFEAILGGMFNPGFTYNTKGDDVKLKQQVQVFLAKEEIQHNVFPFWEATALVWKKAEQPFHLAYIGGATNKLDVATAYDFHLARLAAAADGVVLAPIDDEYSTFRDADAVFRFAQKYLNGLDGANSYRDLSAPNLRPKDPHEAVGVWGMGQVDHHAYGKAVDIAPNPWAVEWMDEKGKFFGFAREDNIEEFRNHFIHKSHIIQGGASLSGAPVILTLNTPLNSLSGYSDSLVPQLVYYTLPDYKIVTTNGATASTDPGLLELVSNLTRYIKDSANTFNGNDVTAPVIGDVDALFNGTETLALISYDRLQLVLAAATGANLVLKQNSPRTSRNNTARGRGGRGGRKEQKVASVTLYNFHKGVWETIP